MEKKRLRFEIIKEETNSTLDTRMGAKGGGGGGGPGRGYVPSYSGRGSVHGYIGGGVACGGCHGRWSNQARGYACLLYTSPSPRD